MHGTCTDVQYCNYSMETCTESVMYSAVLMVCNSSLDKLPKDSQFRWLVLRKGEQEAHKPVYMCPTHGEDGWGEWVRKIVYPYFSMPSEFLHGTPYRHVSMVTLAV